MRVTVEVLGEWGVRVTVEVLGEWSVRVTGEVLEGVEGEGDW